jgi:hypothetical protein
MGLLDIFKKGGNEFYLENVKEQNKKYPRTFLIPSQEDIDNIKEGTLVKLVFVMEKALENSCRAEKMWVKVESIHHGTYTGILDNDPYYIMSIKAGAKIMFNSSNIACIYGGESSLNEKLFAIITKRALENRQINWVVRTEDLNNEQDSGWQLFFGDESEDYLDDSKNSTIVLLENVLSFEPLLEETFKSKGHSYEYSERLNKFVEVER